MMADQARPFYYQTPWKSASVHAGEHQGTQRGLGDEFKQHLSLIDYPDARRLDLRQTLRDPYEQVQVRVFHQDATTPLYAICDVSSSMQFMGKQRKLDTTMAIAASVARSAHDNGDLFSLICYDQQVIPHLTFPPSQHAYQSFACIEQLGQHRKPRVDASGLQEAASTVGQQKGLVFWISDFHQPIADIEHALNLLANHAVIPLVLWDPMEYQRLPRFGFGYLQDPETGQQKTVFFRPSLQQAFAELFSERKDRLDTLFLQYETQAMYIGDAYDADVLSRYFEARMA